MPHQIPRRFALAFIASQTIGASHADEPKGIFGFAVMVDADGIFSPTLKTVNIKSVDPGMPAALAGIVAGDSIIEVQGIKVAGAKASQMAELMKRKPGESVVLKLSRTLGGNYEVKLIAVASRT